MKLKKSLAMLLALLLILALSACGSSPPPSPSAAPTSAPAEGTDAPTPEPTEAPEETPTAEPTATAEPTPTETATPEPSPTAEVDSAGAGALVFDIYGGEARRDINFDGTDEEITFTSGASKSTLEIDGKQYEVAKPKLAGVFAITDIDTSDKILEFVFTDAYDEDLADSEKASSWLYWWNGSKLMLMGGLMDVKFDGAWRSSFKAADVIDGKGQVNCLARTQELTDIWYIAYYKTTGTGRKLYEWRHTATPVNEVGELTCKTVCLIQSNHDESGRDKNKYATSEYDYYWIPTLSPTTLGRVQDPAAGIKVIARPGDKLTIIGTYGPTWFKVKTQDNITGWIHCKHGNVGAYNATMGWTAQDMFEGLISAG